MKQFAEFHDYDTFRRALKEVRESRDLSFELMNEITGAPSGYFQKLLGPNPVKTIGLQSMGWALHGLGVKCLIVEDPEALALVQGRFEARDAAHLISATSRWQAG